MAQANATGLQPRLPTGQAAQASADLAALLARLSPAQAQAVIRIAESELAGQSVESLFEGPRKICSRTTYYRKRGWAHKPEFLLALAQARREIRAQRLTDVVEDAIAELKLSTPLAAADLRRQIAGDETAIDALADILADHKKTTGERKAAVNSLAQIGTPRATQALLGALHDGDCKVRLAVVEAMGAAASGLSASRRMADVAVLDRADKGTASKGVTPADEFADLPEDELNQLIANLKAAIGAGDDVQAPPAAPQPERSD